MLQGDWLKRLLQGAAAGAVATIFVGFYWGGWSLGSTADKMAKGRSELAVVAALAPVCADKFRALPDAAATRNDHIAAARRCPDACTVVDTARALKVASELPHPQSFAI